MDLFGFKDVKPVL